MRPTVRISLRGFVFMDLRPIFALAQHGRHLAPVAVRAKLSALQFVVQPAAVGDCRLLAVESLYGSHQLARVVIPAALLWASVSHIFEVDSYQIKVFHDSPLMLVIGSAISFFGLLLP